MKLYNSAVALILLVSTSFAMAAGSGAGPATPQAGTDPLMKQEQLGKPDIAGDGINNATQVDSPDEIGNQSDTANDSPVPAPTEGDVGVQNAK